MTTREKFKHLVIEAIHGLPYEEAVKQEVIKNVIQECARCKNEMSYVEINGNYCGHCSDYTIIIPKETQYKPYPITMGRVMQALGKDYGFFQDHIWERIYNDNKWEDVLICNWKLAKENGQECTDDYQSDGTIEKLLKLFQ